MAQGEGMLILIQVVSWLATICISLLLFPQIILNFRRRSTEGLSLGLILLWHASALLIYPYLIHTKEPFALQLQWAIFNVASVLTELQFTQYRKAPKHPLLVPGLAVLYFSTNAVGVAALVFAFRALDRASLDWMVEAIGSVLGSIFLAAGFFPQIYEMCRSKSSDGFSLGVTFFDLSGSGLSIVTLLLQHGRQVQPGAVVPYAVIIALQVVVLTLATLVYPSPNGIQLCGSGHGPSPPPPEAAEEEGQAGAKQAEVCIEDKLVVVVSDGVTAGSNGR